MYFLRVQPLLFHRSFVYNLDQSEILVVGTLKEYDNVVAITIALCATWTKTAVPDHQEFFPTSIFIRTPPQGERRLQNDFSAFNFKPTDCEKSGLVAFTRDQVA